MMTGVQRFSVQDLPQVEYKYALVNQENPKETFYEHSTLPSNCHNRCFNRQSILDYLKSKQRSRSSDQGHKNLFKVPGWEY